MRPMVRDNVVEWWNR